MSTLNEELALNDTQTDNLTDSLIQSDLLALSRFYTLYANCVVCVQYSNSVFV
jgi:hypothetical protein